MHNVFRISKYDPKKRINGIYLEDEWTDYSDVGKIYNGEELTFKQYKTIENNYVNVAVEIAKSSGSNSFTIIGLEIYDEDISYINNQDIDILKMVSVIEDCLRNRCWCVIDSVDCKITFGFDYYMYISTKIEEESVRKISKKNNLYVEEKQDHSERFSIFENNIGDGSVCSDES